MPAPTFIIETVEKPTRYRMYDGGEGVWTPNRKIAQVFSEHGRNTLPLPSGGCWVKVEAPETQSNDTEPKFKVGDYVEFSDEHGTRKISFVTAIVPVGEYSATELGYAIRGDYGDHIRVADDIRPPPETPARCICHSGSVCTEGCEVGICHEGCNQFEVERAAFQRQLAKVLVKAGAKEVDLSAEVRRAVYQKPERIPCPPSPRGCGGSGFILIPRPVNSMSIFPDVDEVPCEVCHETGEVDPRDIESEGGDD